MAFVVEDGTGLPNANSYSDVAYADEYFEERGITAWAGDEAQKQTWLIQATDYIQQVFGSRFVGTKATVEQALAWPRAFATTRDGVDLDNDIVPLAVIRACCQYALRAIQGPLMPDPLVSAEGYNVVTTRKKIGPIEKEFRVMGSSGYPILVRSYPAADSLLTSLLVGGTGGTRVIR
jgi:hypothetical protein